jgi:hypothetical protein
MATIEIRRIGKFKNAHCQWCSGVSKRGGYVYRFASEQRGTHTGLFCCKECHDAWHNMTTTENTIGIAQSDAEKHGPANPVQGP